MYSDTEEDGEEDGEDRDVMSWLEDRDVMSWLEDRDVMSWLEDRFTALLELPEESLDSGPLDLMDTLS